MRPKAYSLALLAIPWAIFAQAVKPTEPPRLDKQGVYEVATSDLKKIDSSPKMEFPRELAAYELADTVVIELTISPDGKVNRAKAIDGKIAALKEAATNTVKKWAFQPYLVNGTPVPVRTNITFSFDNTLDRYREPNGDVPVHLDENSVRALLTKKVNPEYPRDARAGRIQGQVELRVIVGEDGRVHGLHIIRGHPMLAAAAYNGVRQWEFKPYVEKGKTVPVDTKITINFTLAG